MHVLCQLCLSLKNVSRQNQLRSRAPSGLLTSGAEAQLLAAFPNHALSRSVQTSASILILAGIWGSCAFLLSGVLPLMGRVLTDEFVPESYARESLEPF